MSSNLEAKRGIIASVASSVCFGGVYFVTPMLSPASAESLWGIRNLVTIPIIALGLLVIGQRHRIAEIWQRILKKPLLILGIIVCGMLVAMQLWIFTWAPLHGRGLQVALGYFLLPLVLVLVGKFLYKDKLLWWQWLAAAIAAVGVIFEIVRVGSISWETLLVCLGYPCYFVLRRALGLDDLGGMFWEFVAMSPFALTFVALAVADGSAIDANPALLWAAPLFSVWTGIALMCYILASRLLTISLFGLLSYLEPALLVVASILIGERIAAAEFPLYIAIWVAVFVLIGGGLALAVRHRRNGGSAPTIKL
ncbi:EamA family transporter RarD [Leucobacter sp. cx-328]|uniref:EamA family transporter RarD n=1 Tax=unclassified Leucobacter TaxID=2621730 RepID=UPI00165DEDCC|nr:MULTISPECIES: EamA family transporter RarD [unclassified Leucobacter]MBC9944674.1 EamA family transporter RarD [Leucobacter sp. cx-328]